MMMALGPLALNCPELEREIVTALVLNYKSLKVPIGQGGNSIEKNLA